MRKTIGLVVFVLMFVSASAYFIWAETIKPEPLSHAELAERIQVIYDVKPTYIAEQQDRAIFRFKKDGITYNITVDELDGHVEKLVKIAGTYSVPEKQQDDSMTKMLTDDEAIAIAHKELAGSVEALSYRSTSDGGYYLIDIDGDDAEATFQIHALSGEILSITWDD